MCGDMVLRLRDAWRGVEDIVPAPESGRPPPCTAQATAGASRLLRPPCAGTAWPPCMRWQRRRPVGCRQSVRGRTLRVSARAGPESWIVNRPEYGRKHWPGRKGRAEGQGGRAGRGPWAGGRPPTRQEAACKDAQAWRGARGHAKGPHAVTGIAGRVVEGQRGIGSIGRSGTLRGGQRRMAHGNAGGRGAAARPPGDRMRGLCAGPGLPVK